MKPVAKRCVTHSIQSPLDLLGETCGRQKTRLFGDSREQLPPEIIRSDCILAYASGEKA